MGNWEERLASRESAVLYAQLFLQLASAALGPGGPGRGFTGNRAERAQRLRRQLGSFSRTGASAGSQLLASRISAESKEG